MSQEEVDAYRQKMLLLSDEVLRAVKMELQGHIEFIDAELERRKDLNE